ncbi:MAG: response regulator [Myxococcales bacterium]|jgi:two-component system alkaline phosphatase synthesis response regulator PhoP|nr:MAG: response regulator [Myxococcales bacterium]
MARESVLLVEDEEDICELIRYNLDREGYRVIVTTSGEAGLNAARREAPDLVLLDLMLPGVDGLEVCRRLKSEPRTSLIPIIMVTARGEESEIVTGIELGADDYVTKPFSPRVLVARTRSVLRRPRAEQDDTEAPVHAGGLEIHPGRHEVLAGHTRVELTSTEFKILHLLARRPGWVFTRYQIVDGVRGPNYPVTERAVDVQIVALRKKLGSYGTLLETVRGVGYRFKE